MGQVNHLSMPLTIHTSNAQLLVHFHMRLSKSNAPRTNQPNIFPLQKTQKLKESWYLIDINFNSA